MDYDECLNVSGNELAQKKLEILRKGIDVTKDPVFALANEV